MCAWKVTFQFSRFHMILGCGTGWNIQALVTTTPKRSWRQLQLSHFQTSPSTPACVSHLLWNGVHGPGALYRNPFLSVTISFWSRWDRHPPALFYKNRSGTWSKNSHHPSDLSYSPNPLSALSVSTTRSQVTNTSLPGTGLFISCTVSSQTPRHLLVLWWVTCRYASRFLGWSVFLAPGPHHC